MSKSIVTKSRNRMARLGAFAAAMLAACTLAAAAPGDAEAAAYKIYVDTCDVWGAGTDANVSVMFEGTEGNTPWLLMDTPWHDDFERNSFHAYDWLHLADVGTVKSIQVKRDSWGISPNWCFESAAAYKATTGAGPYYTQGHFFNYNWVGTSGVRVYPGQY